jgi:hypothetical protein
MRFKCSSTPAQELNRSFLIEAELKLREWDNLLRILRKKNWKIKGPDGAAELLGVKSLQPCSRA